MNKLTILLILITSTLIGCSGVPEQYSEPAVLKAPTLTLNSSAKGAHGGSTVNKALDNHIKLPLITWTTFQYRMINLKPGWSQGSAGKENFCVVKETDGIPATEGSSVIFLEDATCFYTYYTSADAIPHKYQIGIVKIRIPETGEEVWTWRTAVEITKQSK